MSRDFSRRWFYTSYGVTANSSLSDIRDNNLSTILDQHADWKNELETELFQGYSPALLTFASVCCIVYMMVGVPGNLITIIALFRCKKVRIYISYLGYLSLKYYILSKVNRRLKKKMY